MCAAVGSDSGSPPFGTGESASTTGDCFFRCLSPDNAGAAEYFSCSSSCVGCGGGIGAGIVGNLSLGDAGGAVCSSAWQSKSSVARADGRSGGGVGGACCPPPSVNGTVQQSPLATRSRLG